MKTIKKNIYQLNKTQLFVIGFYISIMAIMLLGALSDLIIQNYIDLYFDIFFMFCSALGLFFYYYSRNLNIANHIIILISTIGSYVFFITSQFMVSTFISIVSLSFFLLFSLKRSLFYNLIHHSIVICIYIYAYTNEPHNPIFDNFSTVMATFIASMLMIFLGVVYHISVENSYKKLEKSNREKEILLRELHHRVKNNLQIILSIVQLQSNQIAENKVFAELENRIEAISKTYDMLIIHENLHYIEMQKYIESLLFNIREGFSLEHKNIVVKSHIDVSLPLKEATYLGIIMNELVTNSYKHAFNASSKGCIEIDFKQYNGHYRLMIRDNGQGFDNNQIKKSLGLELVYALVREQLFGTIVCYNKGETKYIIDF